MIHTALDFLQSLSTFAAFQSVDLLARMVFLFSKELVAMSLFVAAISPISSLIDVPSAILIAVLMVFPTLRLGVLLTVWVQVFPSYFF